MLFNSIEFALFLPLVFFLYWSIPARKVRAQNVLLLAASYFFYGWWDWRFLSLIAVSSLVDYLVGLGLLRTAEVRRRRLLLFASIAVNLGFLGFFKYFNFFADSFARAFTFFGGAVEDTALLSLVLPVGISFYTFQTLSYSIDVYRGKLRPTTDPIAFFSFVSFFPQLVAGPIERATNLLPQFRERRSFDYSAAADGVRQMIWGLFKKMVIADNCATQVDIIFGGSSHQSGSTLALGAFLFAFQIYGDFSGYSDMAIGMSRLFGFNLMRNFAFPYFSRDIAEFWRRWHISLSTWFRDYVYIPLGGSRGSVGRKIRNTLIIFAVSGLWHGANWTFVVWGLLNALYFLPLLISNRNRRHTGIIAEGRALPTVGEAAGMLGTFGLTMIAWVFFRSESVPHAIRYLAGMLDSSLFTMPSVDALPLVPLIAVLLVTEWLQRGKQHALDLSGIGVPRPVRWALYYAVIFLILRFQGSQQEFIYFQF